MLCPAVVAEFALCHAVPMTAATWYQYVDPLLSAPLVHDVAVLPLATRLKPLVEEVVDW
jgi:predicted Co/Zn/Cd cation transporter (cation efflux family)